MFLRKSSVVLHAVVFIYLDRRLAIRNSTAAVDACAEFSFKHLLGVCLGVKVLGSMDGSS